MTAGFLDRLHPSFRDPGDREPNIAYFIARQGGEAELWTEEYTRPEHVEMIAATNRALQALRLRRIEAGRRELRAAEEGFRAAASTAPPSVHHILGRWYYGALAYLHYCTEEFAAAEEALERADEEVREAIDQARFLLPYATECYEFWFQRVRVARNRRRWDEVWRRIEIARQIFDGERPCCVLSDGTRIDMATVQDFYRGLPALDEAERRPLLRFLDEESRQVWFRALLGEIYALPGFVIPYPPAPSVV
ncbi:MAG TPA: hypothetical protein VGH73_12950 [Thermoanaerobaculia bacterium]|jgi:hypothetical protein